MKRTTLFSLLLSLTCALQAQQVKVEPAFWWSGMAETELQLMVYGKDIGFMHRCKAVFYTVFYILFLH